MDPYVTLISAIAGLVAIIGGIAALFRWSRPRMPKVWTRARDPKATKPTKQIAAAPRVPATDALDATGKKELGKLHRNSGGFREAQRLFTEAYDEFVAQGNIKGQANARMNRGILFRMMEKWADSEEDHKNADSLYLQSHDPRGQADNLKNYGALYRDMGNQRRAIEIHQQSLEIYEALGMNKKVAELRQQIGIDYAQLGETQTARRYLDQSQHNSDDGVDPREHEDARYRELRQLMPELLAEMKQDLADDESGLITELAVLPSETVIFNSAKSRFVYYENKHANLQNKIDMLEEHGLIRDVSTGNVPIYRLTGEFIRALRSL